MPKTQPFGTMAYISLNESPSKKEGKCGGMIGSYPLAEPQ